MKLFKTPLLALAMFAALAAWSMQPVSAEDAPQIPDDAAQYMILIEGMT
ncbi:MAG: hypothetical protein ACIAXF_15765 [Phycisphaerales bacterium JB063]